MHSTWSQGRAFLINPFSFSHKKTFLKDIPLFKKDLVLGGQMNQVIETRLDNHRTLFLVLSCK